jgi:hypothetical protein
VGHVSGLVCESPGAWLSTNSVAPPHVADVLRSAEVSLAELPYITGARRRLFVAHCSCCALTHS